MNGNGTNAVASSSKSSPPPPTAPKSNLILPAWDVPPLKPLHPSHDLISLLSLASLYNTYVRPYAQGVDEDNAQNGAGADGDGSKSEQMNGVVPSSATKGKGGPGARQKGTRLERGYTGLLDDCIDPMPDGGNAAPSLIPLIKDLTFQPTGPAPEIWDGPIEVWPVDKWNVATLEVGSQSGYKGGMKDGVQKAEEKRQRKREARALALSAKPPATATANANPLTPGPTSAPGTPLLPVAPPSKAGIPGFSSRRKESISGLPAGRPRPPPINPGQADAGPSSAGRVPGPARTASFRPTSAAAGPATPGGSGQPGGVKRVYEGQGAGMSKKAKVAGTRSASPAPTALGKAGDGKPAQQPGQGKTQVRPGLGKGSRARTEGM